jgi:hypothetical protein
MDYRRLVQYDKSFHGQKLRLLLEWHEIIHIIGKDIDCLVRWLGRAWLIQTFPDFASQEKDLFIRRLTGYLTKNTIQEWKDIIIEYCIMDFLLNDGFGISDVRSFDPTEIFTDCKNNTKILIELKNNIKFSTDGHAYALTKCIKGTRDYELSHTIIRLWTEQKVEKIEAHINSLHCN